MKENTDRQEAALSLLKDLLSIRSVNGTDDEGAAAEYLQHYFEMNGIRSEVCRIDGKHANVIAFVPGRHADETMIWNGHLDTVPYGDLHAWHTDPSRPAIADGRLFGRGASDMKSGLAAMAFALCGMVRRGVKPARGILFLGTCDEEKGGLGAEAALALLRSGHPLVPADVQRCVAGAAPADGQQYRTVPSGDQEAGRPFLLIGEPTSLRPGTAQKGCLWLQMDVKGRTSHGAYPEQGINAVSCGMEVAAAIADFVSAFTHPLLGRATAQVTQIEGGVAPNMTPDKCRIVMDVRMVPGLTAGQVIDAGERVLSVLRQKHPGLDIAFSRLNDRRAISVDEAHPQVSKLRTLLKDAGHDDSPIGISFFTDASVLDRDDRMDICLFGPGDPAMAHQPDEYVETDRYLEAIRILEAFCDK